ncbi:hypothetical protein XaC1_508 [Xanthomonas phage XaC1]|nr:hypothetical protein XaC1_508 [Xanthomonas phage XaC1]
MSFKDCIKGILVTTAISLAGGVVVGIFQYFSKVK